MIMKMSRVHGLDLIRSLATFSVIAGHFFMNTGFQNEEFSGVSMFIQGCVLRNAGMRTRVSSACSFSR